MSHADDGPMISIRRGNIHLSRELCHAHLPDVGAVALLARDDTVLIVPLARQSAGGLLLKIRNARGDRVVHAQEFLRARGLPEDFEERQFPVYWIAELKALAILGLPECKLALHSDKVIAGKLDRVLS
jgi:hypothetical protein